MLTIITQDSERLLDKIKARISPSLYLKNYFSSLFVVSPTEEDFTSS